MSCLRTHAAKMQRGVESLGSGTQKVEQELKALFPDTEVLRMDCDTVPCRQARA